MKRIFGASAVAIASVLWCVSAIAQDDTGTMDQPGPSNSGTGQEEIHLHMPVHHAAQQTPSAHEASAPATDSPAPEKSAPATVDAIGAAPTPPPPPPPVIKRSEAPAPVKAETRATPTKATPSIPFSFGEDSEEAASPPPAPSPPAPPVKTAALPPHPAPVQTEKPPASEERAGLAKRGAVMFERGASDPSPAQFKGVKLLASDLSSALESGASRIELEAYGGAPGDKSSDARRLSLRRALAVRQLLIDGGVPSTRIDVRAMGGVDDRGAPDRVDVFVRT